MNENTYIVQLNAIFSITYYINSSNKPLKTRIFNSYKVNNIERGLNKQTNIHTYIHTYTLYTINVQMFILNDCLNV